MIFLLPVVTGEPSPIFHSKKSACSDWAIKFTIVPRGATRGEISIFAESSEVTSNDLSTVVTFP